MQNADRSTKKLAKLNTTFNFKQLKKVEAMMGKNKRNEKDWQEKNVKKGLKFFQEAPPGIESSRQCAMANESDLTVTPCCVRRAPLELKPDRQSNLSCGPKLRPER